MAKIRLGKRFLSLLTAGGLIFVAGTSMSGCGNNNKGNEESGYEDISPIFNFNLDDNDFVILNIGDHNDVKTSWQDKKITYCNDRDISLGVIISSNSKTESEIYNDVEYTKGIVQKYDINLPVYLNIDEIITSDELNLEMKTKLITGFLEKCSANNIKVGLYGNDTNLCRVKEYCNISDYDAYLVMDSKEIKYSGSYSVCKNLDGKITKSQDIAKEIEESGFNDAKKFVSDQCYTVSKNDNITDIALKYGLSVNELLKFNDLDKKDVISGTKLRIPLSSNSSTQIGSGEFEKLDEPIRGCDISYAQGTDIDWQAMKENFEFIILKCNEGNVIDSCYETNAIQCNINDIPMGIYCYNGYTTTNCENETEFRKNQEKQADTTISALATNEVTYPCYLDIESVDTTSLMDKLPKEYVKTMLDVWHDKISGKNYIPGIYCNQSSFEYLQSCVDYDIADKLEVWIAGGDQYTSEQTDIDLQDIEPSYVLTKDYGATMAQSTDSAVNCGAENDNGHLDINYSILDYSKEIPLEPSSQNENFKIKEFDRIDTNAILSTSGAIAATVALSGLTIIGIRRNKKLKAKHHKHRRR